MLVMTFSRMRMLIGRVPSIVPMPMVHEQMHQWTREQQKVRQRPKDVGTVLGKQQE